MGIASCTTAWFSGLAIVASRGVKARTDLVHTITQVVCVLLIIYCG